MQCVHRIHRIAVLLGLVMLSSVACHGVAARGSTPVPSQSAVSALSHPNAPADLVAPVRVGHYTRGEARDYGSPEGGVSYDYSNKGTSLTVYFYARDSALRRLGSMEALEAETARFKQVLEIERQRGRWDTYEIAFEGPDSVDVEDSVLLGRQLGVVIKRGKAMYVSLFYLYAVGNEWIEVRGTVPVAGWQRTDVPVFARQLSAMAVADRPKS